MRSMPYASSCDLMRFLAENRDDENHDEDERNRVQDVDEPHHDVVDPAADVAGHRAVGDADRERDQRGDDADDDRNPRSPEHARQHVAAEFIASGNRPERPLAEQAVARADHPAADRPQVGKTGVAVRPMQQARQLAFFAAHLALGSGDCGLRCVGRLLHCRQPRRAALVNSRRVLAISEGEVWMAAQSSSKFFRNSGSSLGGSYC